MVKVRLFHLALLFLFLCIFLTSCLPKTGHISWQASEDVEIDLARGNIPPGFSYYYIGPEAIPHTIIALLDNVPFAQNLWQPATFGKMQVKEWLAAIDNSHRSVDDMYFGGRLLDRKGNFLGIWYSKYRFYSGYLDCDGKLVILHPLRQEAGPLLKESCK